MRKVVFLLVWMMSFGMAQAQWSVSPEAGITAVNMNWRGNDQWNAGWKLGVGVEYQFTSRFALRSGLHYTQRGGSYPLMFWYDATGEFSAGTVKTKQHFLQIPLMAQLGWDLSKDVRLNVAAGGYVAYDTHHSGSYTHYSGFNDYGYEYGYGYGYGMSYGYSSGSADNFFRGLRSFDWGASLAVGLEVNNLYFNLGYDASLSKKYKYDDIGLDYHTLSLTIGYKFRIGK